MKKITLLAIALSMAGFSYAQTEQQATKLSLEEAVEIAIKNNIQIQQSELDVELSNISYIRSKADLYPSLNGQASHAYSFGRSIDPFTNAFTTDPIRSNNFGLSSSIILFNGFAEVNEIKQNKLAVKASQHNLQATKNDVLLVVTDAYLQVLLTKELVDVAALQLNTSEQQLERTKKFVTAGSQPLSAQYEIESQVASDKLNLVNAENNLVIAKLNLLQALQLPADQDVQVQNIEVDMTGITLTETSPDEIFKVAMENQPLVVGAKLQQESAEMAVSVAKGRLMPTLSLNGSVFTQYSSIGTEREYIPTVVEQEAGFLKNDPSQIVVIRTPSAETVVSEIPFMDQLDINRRENLSLNLNVPIFNGLQGRSTVATSKIQSKRAELQLQNVKNQLRISIERAYANARASAARYAAIQDQLKSLELTFENAQKRVDLGAISVIDYNIAKNNFDRARADLAQAKYNYIFAVKVLDFYLGKSLSF